MMKKNTHKFKLDEDATYKGRTFKSAQEARDQVHANYDEYIPKSVLFLTKRFKFCSTDTVLDIGSGLGDIPKMLASRVQKIYCCDINENYLSLAKDNCQDIKNISFHLVEDYDLPLKFLPENHIDKAYAHSVFIHNSTKIIVAYLKELCRVLKTGGTFFTKYCLKNYDKDKRPGTLESDKDRIDSAIKSLGYHVIKNQKFTASYIYGVELSIKK